MPGGGAQMQLRDVPRMLVQLPEDQLASMLTSFAEEVFRLRAGQVQQAQQSAAGVPTAYVGGPVGAGG
eukprot:4135945-Alexandrium_andersonii.AAC.1